MPRIASQQLNVDQEKFIRMEANGYTSAEIILELWGMTKDDDPKAFHAKEAQLSRWRQHPKYEECWKDEIRKQDFSDYSLARKVLRKGMRADEPWLAMQSAVNTLNNSGKRLFRDEENTVTVQIQGTIDLGSPDQDE